MQSEGGSQVTRTSSIEQNVLDTVRRNPNTSVRAFAAAVVGSRSSAYRVLKLKGKPLYSYHLNKVYRHKL
ncbi:hypothetical protein TNCV_1593631 [Trichonephila clavipes]|nr:hypothetical protein TNCV_1593631 [Trichonephila clavipes]